MVVSITAYTYPNTLLHFVLQITDKVERKDMLQGNSIRQNLVSKSHYLFHFYVLPFTVISHRVPMLHASTVNGNHASDGERCLVGTKKDHESRKLLGLSQAGNGQMVMDILGPRSLIFLL